jgi:predicted lysophospholipase L1 biosynthesis ABC-type transport system permease subunit
MKSIVMPKTVQLSEEIKKQLLHEVKETLATDISVKNKKRFTAANLWNLQRNSRSASYMMRR